MNKKTNLLGILCPLVPIISLKMKLTILFLVIALFRIQANTYAQNTKITLDLDEVSMMTVLNEIEAKTEFKFLGNHDVIDTDNLVSINVKKERIEKILKKLFASTGITYKIIDKQIILKKGKAKVPIPKYSKSQSKNIMQQSEVKGTVVDADGLPLIGATIVEKGTTNGVSTDFDGNFTISMQDASNILVISYVGFLTKEFAVDGQTDLSITLNEDSQNLDEVVVTGYRKQARGTITGSISTVKTALLEDLPAESLSSVLAGRLSGVTVTQGAGTPGTASDIQVRSRGTLNNTAPLYVIDGIVSTKFAFDALSTVEVDNITLLKDAATAAIYGSRGANGVVLVTTKRGSNRAPTITYSGQAGVQVQTRRPEMLSAYQQGLLINDALAYDRYFEQGFQVDPNDPLLYTPDELEHFRTNDHDWLDILWRNPTSAQHSLSASGGSEHVNYFVGGTYNTADAFLDNVDFKRSTLRANVDVKLAQGLTASLDLHTNSQTRNATSRGDWAQETLYKSLLVESHFSPPSINGQWVGNSNAFNAGAEIALESGYQEFNWTGVTATVSLNYEIPFIEGLSANVKYNQFRLNEKTKRFAHSYDMPLFGTTGDNNHILTEEVVGSRTRSYADELEVTHTDDKSYQFNIQANYKKSFGKHNLDTFFVYEQTESESDFTTAQRNNFISFNVDQFIGGGASVEDQTAGGSESETARLSYVGSLSYNYDRTYLLDLSFRYDGSVIFAPENRWGFFPSVSAGWVVSNESFFKAFKSKVISNVKLRASVGLLGNDAVGAFQWQQNYALGSGAAFDGVTSSLSEGTLANRNITWEKSLNYNGGIDVSLWKGMMNLKLDMFYRHTYDILDTRAQVIPSTFGATLPDENYAEVNAKGFEFELNFNDSFGSGKNKIDYFIGGNFSYATNELVAYDEAEGIRPHLSRIGHPIGIEALQGFRGAEVLRTQADVDALPDDYTIYINRYGNLVPEVGMLNYEDIRGVLGVDEPDGRITNIDDMEYLAENVDPPMTYGLSVGATWRQLSFNVLLQGNAGNYAMMIVDGRRLQARADENSAAFWADRWTPSNPDGRYPAALRYGWPPTDYPDSDLWLRNMSFLRLKAMNLSYSLPEKLTSKMKLKGLRLFYSGTNLGLLFDNVKDWGIDPELTNWRVYPNLATHSFGLSLSL